MWRMIINMGMRRFPKLGGSHDQPAPPVVNRLLVETGTDILLQENGDTLITEG